MTLTDNDTVLPKSLNNEHPKHELNREQLRKALRRVINSRRIGSTGHIVRWIINDYGELQSEYGRKVRT